MRSLIGYGFLALPTIFIWLSPLGAAVALVWRRAGITVALTAGVSLFVAATPATSSILLTWIESKIQRATDFGSAQAIVVVGADFRPGDAIAPDNLGPLTLERLFFAAEAYRQLHLPVAVSGGRSFKSQSSIAELMKAALERYFNVPVTWSEDNSRTTYENAAYTAKILHNADIHTVIVITQARDAPRVIWSFEQVGLNAVPWPSPRTKLTINRITDFLPSTTALDETFFALHELLGTFYYRVRY
jgi:uncharacterized SAM-binding protein YcdF (DUF218 family)